MESNKNFNERLESALQAHKKNDLLSAETLYRQCLKIQASPEAQYLLGLLLAQKKDYLQSIFSLEQVISQNINNAEIFNALAINYEKLRHFKTAARLIKKALKISPHAAQYLNRYCKILIHQHNYDNAISIAENNIAINPSYGAAYVSLSLAYSGSMRKHKSLQILKKGLRHAPGNADILFNLAENYQSLRYFDKAKFLYQSLINNHYMVSECLTNLSAIEKELGYYKQAHELLNQALNVKSYNPLAQWNRCLLNLLQGNYNQNWRDYDLGLTLGQRKTMNLNIRLWKGESLTNKSIIITKEQGIGDEIMFARAIPLLAKKAQNCTLICSQRLKNTFTLSYPNVSVIGDEELQHLNHKKYDYYISVGSVFQYINISDLSDSVNTLKSEFTSLNQQQFLHTSHAKQLKIGFAWRGGSDLPEKLRRSTHIRHWQALFLLAGVEYYCLQKGTQEKDKKLIHHFSNENVIFDQDISKGENLDKLVAFIAQMDLIITVDNTVAHLAAASGVETWCLLSLSPDWRWGLNSSTSHWYESIRLFRQKRFNNWNTVFEEVKKCLIKERLLLQQ